MDNSAARPAWLTAARLGVALTGLGGVCIVAGWLLATLVADHSSSDSSPSSLLAVGLGLFGFAAVVLGAVLFAGANLTRFGRWGRPGQMGRPGWRAKPGKPRPRE